MEIKLLGAIDYETLTKKLQEKNIPNIGEILEIVDQLEKEGRVNKVAAAGRLSRFPGDVLEILGITEDNTLEENVKFIRRVTKMGHDSITDHDYLVFAIKNVSPIIEQTIIAERFSSFTIKSRREVDFSGAGFYVPEFRGTDGEILADNDVIKEKYRKYMSSLFFSYTQFVEQGVPLEDARFVLPYCFYSNILMGVDAHVLKDMIIEYTKGHLSKMQEIKKFGEELYEIAQSYCPFIIKEIDSAPVEEEDAIRSYLNGEEIPKYQVLSSPMLVNKIPCVDRTIMRSAIMKRYQLHAVAAHNYIESVLEKNPAFAKEFMRKIVFSGDGKELAQVAFQFQIPLSFAVLTHLTRHRTHHILVPEFSPVVDLGQYIVPPIMEASHKEEFEAIFARNQIMCDVFRKEYGICEEDLAYFTLSGNAVNVTTMMDGKTLAHILALRECGKAQWETQRMARGMHDELRKYPDAAIFSSLIGPTCETLGICKEGKESCGRILELKNKESANQ